MYDDNTQKESNCDKTQKQEMRQNSKLKLWENKNCEKTQKHKLWPYSRTQIVTKSKVKLGQNSKTLFRQKLTSNCDLIKLNCVTL